jgi:ribosome-binding protein aMBF1 (putative translation factor)
MSRSAARALVGWSREDLAAKAEVSAETVKRFEFRGSDPNLSTLNKVKRALEAAGVRFIEADPQGGSGVRFADASLEERVTSKKSAK